MEKVIYNKNTKEVSTDSIDSKLIEKDVKGKVYKDYQGWTNAVVYSVEEIKEIGKPKQFHVPVLIDLGNGEIKEFASGFYQSALDEKNINNRPWFGKVVPLKGEKGSEFKIVNLSNGKIVEEKETGGDIRLIDEDYYVIFDQDFSAFDVIGAIDESADYLKRNGVTVLKTYKHIDPQYKDGKLYSVRIGRDEISKQELDQRYYTKIAKTDMAKALNEMIESGVSAEEILSVIRPDLKAENEHTL